MLIALLTIVAGSTAYNAITQRRDRIAQERVERLERVLKGLGRRDPKAAEALREAGRV